MKKTKRKGFNFYRSYFDAYNLCETAEEKVEFMDALLEKQFLSKEPDFEKMNRMVKIIYMGQKHSIDKQVAGYWYKVDGTKEGPTEGTTEGTNQGSIEDPTEGPLEGTSNDTVMTTEGSTEGPWEQEQQQVEEEVKEEEKLEVKEKQQSQEERKIVYVDMYDDHYKIKKALDKGFKVMTNDMEWTYNDLIFV